MSEPSLITRLSLREFDGPSGDHPIYVYGIRMTKAVRHQVACSRCNLFTRKQEHPECKRQNIHTQSKHPLPLLTVTYLVKRGLYRGEGHASTEVVQVHLEISSGAPVLDQSRRI